MRKTFGFLALLVALLVPVAASATTTVNATLIPDGTYIVKVEKIVDPKHIVVLMNNGTETTLSAGRPTVNFSKLAANDKIKLSMQKGAVLVYAKVS